MMMTDPDKHYRKIIAKSNPTTESHNADTTVNTCAGISFFVVLCIILLVLLQRAGRAMLEPEEEAAETE